MKISGYLNTSDNHRIQYDQFKAGFKKVIIIAHGFFNSKQAVILKQLGESLNDKYDVILFDFRGHGQSKGLFYWTAKEYLDLLGIVDFASRSYEKIGLIGLSLGAATSIIAASKTSLINSIVAISAPTELGKIDYRLWMLNIKNDLFYNLFGEGRHGKGVRPGPFWFKKEKPLCSQENGDPHFLYSWGCGLGYPIQPFRGALRKYGRSKKDKHYQKRSSCRIPFP